MGGEVCINTMRLRVHVCASYEAEIRHRSLDDEPCFAKDNIGQGTESRCDRKLGGRNHSKDDANMSDLEQSLRYK
jgi:hypothetical protein